jgi:hypothetical protein
VDDDRLGGGVSPEKAEQLRQLLLALEEQVRSRQHQAGIDELSTEVAKIREAVESGNRTTPLAEIFKSVRNIAEGIVGAAIYDLIPSNLKSSLREELLGAPQDPRDIDDRCLYAVRVQILLESVRAFQFAVDARLPFAFTLNGLEMRIWCGPQLAAMLRLAFEKSDIEHPTGAHLGIRLRVLTPRQAEVVKAGLMQVQEEIALAILRPSSGLSPEEVANNVLANLRQPKAVLRRAILPAAPH